MSGLINHKLYKRENKKVEFSTDTLKRIREIITHYPAGRKKSALLPVLHIAQQELGSYLSVDVMDYVASLLELQSIEVYEVATGAARLIALAATSEPVIVLARTPRTVLELRHAGVPIEVVDLGGMGSGPGRRRLHKTISVSPDELRELRELEKMGTRVEIQIVADDRPIPFRSLDSES